MESLKPSHRLYSHTVWCFGNLWNVYVQIVRKKGLQLGVYLQRQSFVDPIPAHSVFHSPQPSLHHSISLNSFSTSLAASSLSLSQSRSNERPSTGGVASPSRGRAWAIPHSSSTSNIPMVRAPTPSTPLSSPIQAYGTPTHGGLSAFMGTTPPSGTPPPPQNIPATAPSQAPLSPYRDPRQSIRAYFMISCPSATGSSLTRFTSAPDTFNVTSSWGWKSSKAEEWVDIDEVAITGGNAVGAGNPGATKTRAAKEVSLRATIVLGVV